MRSLRNLNLLQPRHARLKADSNAADETEINYRYPLLSSPRLEALPNPRSSRNTKVIVHTIRSLYPKTLEIPFHSTEQPVLRMLLPRRTGTV